MNFPLTKAITHGCTAVEGNTDVYLPCVRGEAFSFRYIPPDGETAFIHLGCAPGALLAILELQDKILHCEFCNPLKGESSNG